MKDGRTHMGHKVEHAVDMESGAVVAVTIHGGCDGDTQTIESTLEESLEALGDVVTDSEAAAQVSNTPLAEIVADKGYHSNAVLVTCKEQEIRTYIQSPSAAVVTGRTRLRPGMRPTQTDGELEASAARL